MDTKPTFQDFTINIKLKLTCLWAAVTLCYLYGDYFELYVPGKVKDLGIGRNLLDTPLKLLAAALLLAIPALMVVLSIFLKPQLNRLLNLTFGVFYTFLMLLIAIANLGDAWMYFYVFLALVEASLTMLIVYHAWRWPKTDM